MNSLVSAFRHLIATIRSQKNETDFLGYESYCDTNRGQIAPEDRPRITPSRSKKR
jgi:hypothetical protein